MISIGSVVNGKYRLARLLGDGGMGSVYEAHHAVLGTRVAIKVLHPELLRRTGLVERFLQEARVAAQIRSPHVVQVTDVERTPDGQAYIVMELLEGEPLSSVLDRQRKLSVATACDYTLQILSALEAAHALGVIHRDLKPENVFVTFVAGRAVLKLIDFGIAKARRASPQQKNLTVAGVMMGTAEYMAPEQARSADRVDARADIYAAGVMLYEMIAGARPVAGDDARLIALKVERGEVVPLVQAAPNVPREIAGLVHRAMAARPELRFATATDMRLALEKAAHGRRPGTAAMAAGPHATAAPALDARTMAGGMHGHPGGSAAPGVEARPPGASPLAPSGDEDAAPVHTMRAPPIASALAPPAYGGAAVPAAPAPPGGSRVRRRSGAVTVALVGLPILVGAGVVGVLAASGTWSSGPSGGDPTPPYRAPVEEDAQAEAATVTAAPTTPPKSDVPRLVPTAPPSPVAPARPPPTAPKPTPAAAPDAGGLLPVPPPFVFPSALPTSLPPFPSVLPFPTSLPAGFPSVLPSWPPAPAGPSPGTGPSRGAASDGGMF